MDYNDILYDGIHINSFGAIMEGTVLVSSAMSDLIILKACDIMSIRKINKQEVIMNLMKWLMEGDVSVQYRVKKELLGEEDFELKNSISEEGYGKRFLDKKNDNGHWGREYYQPKWINSHYTLLDLKYLGISSNESIDETLNLILENNKSSDGGINPSKGIDESDVCINGMCLNYMCHFGVEESKLKSIVDCFISQQMADGGFNCNYKRPGAVHSSLHSTISNLEGINSYYVHGYKYRIDKLMQIKEEAVEFILKHHLYKSDKTGEVIKKSFTMFSYPSRWKYDILRCLEYFVDANVKYDDRMKDAIDLLIHKRKKDGTWTVQAKHSGEVHFDMEATGKSSRWNTLRALKVLNYYQHDLLLNEVLGKVVSTFNDNNVRFGVGASLLLKAYDIISDVNDIDIIVHPDDINKASEIMDSLGYKKEVLGHVSYKTEHFLEYCIDGIDFDIMSNMAMTSDTGVYVYPFKEEELTYRDIFGCTGLPLLSLENWYVAYMMIGRPEKVELLFDFLTKNGFDKDILKENLLLQVNDSVKLNINKLLNGV